MAYLSAFVSPYLCTLVEAGRHGDLGGSCCASQCDADRGSLP